MHPSSTTLLLGAAAVAFGATPQGFEPASNTDLFVTFGDTPGLNGVDLQKAVTQSEPTIGTSQKLAGTSFAIAMVDIDIPTNSPPATGTLLHWLQTGFVQDATATAVGGQNIFALKSSQAPAASYIGPSPPARVPLNHRYIEVLVDTTNMTPEGSTVLEGAAAGGRQGVDLQQLLTQAGLADKVVAGNFFTVTNPGPAQ